MIWPIIFLVLPLPLTIELFSIWSILHSVVSTSFLYSLNNTRQNFSILSILGATPFFLLIQSCFSFVSNHSPIVTLSSLQHRAWFYFVFLLNISKRQCHNTCFFSNGILIIDKSIKAIKGTKWLGAITLKRKLG